MPKNTSGSQKTILNSEIRDSGAKIIFDDHILCSQFLRDYIDLPFLKNVRPEDIEDVSEQYVTLFAEERNSDRVKKVTIKNEKPFFLISLIEHKTKIDYNVAMQIFRYMVYIWDAYEKESEKQHPGISHRKDFRYPPILPIVYYEGSHKWTAPLKSTPDYLVKTIADIMLAFLLTTNVSQENAEAMVDKIKEKKMSRLFENVKIDFAAAAKKAAQADERAAQADERAAQAEKETRQAKEQTEKGIQSLMEAWQELGNTKELALQKLMDTFNMDEAIAEEKLQLYWKD